MNLTAENAKNAEPDAVDMAVHAPLKAPFPWFGGKSRVAGMVWERFGDVPNYIEPFYGSGAVLLGRPHAARLETVNDADGFVANFWRAVSQAPEETAAWADHPVFEIELHARHAWLVRQKEGLPARLEGAPDYFDAKIAGWWCWGICCWIGGGFCSGAGPWHSRDGQLVHLGNKGQGVNRQLVHLGNKGKGVNAREDLAEWFGALAARLRHVRVCCGDWSRICGESVTVKHGLTGVFLDPPYSIETGRDEDLYRIDCGQVAHAVREWAIANGNHPLMRIALCGYAGEHEMPADWECLAWKAPGGYGSISGGNGNGALERIWFSPHCLKADQPDLFSTKR